MDTIRVDLGDGDSAIMYSELKHGTSRKVQAIYAPYLKTKDAQKVIESVKNGDDEGMNKLYELMGSAPSIEATDTMILGQVESWSFGEVTQEMLDDIAERKREILSNKCDELYAYPLAMSGREN